MAERYLFFNFLIIKNKKSAKLKQEYEHKHSELEAQIRLFKENKLIQEQQFDKILSKIGEEKG